MLSPAGSLCQVLPVVVSGRRPALKQRPVAKLLRDLHGVTADPVWVVMGADAARYEGDGHEIAVYSREWAETYAARHWTGISPLEPGGFLGAFPGREFACRLAEERGCWAVLQLDDNINRLQCFRGSKAGTHVAAAHGGLGMFADVLAAVTLSTNGRMTGAFLDSVNPNVKTRVSRPGFPYSLFLERTGPGREEWFGPFEDDITHAYQYGSSADSGTPLLVPSLRYKKETTKKTGMRAHYNGERSVSLQRIFPETAKVGVRKTTSNGRGRPRVFHTMLRGAIRTPQAITDHDLYAQVSAYLTDLAREFAELQQQNRRRYADQRANRWQ